MERDSERAQAVFEALESGQIDLLRVIPPDEALPW
jgi:hypothetical protein